MKEQKKENEPRTPALSPFCGEREKGVRCGLRACAVAKLIYARAQLSPSAMTEPANRPVESFKRFAAWLAALFLVVLGAKLWVVQLYGSPLLWWDQWYEATTFIKGGWMAS